MAATRILRRRRVRRGTVLILAMAFVIIFTALGAALASISGTNVQIAHGLRTRNGARASAESGLEVMHYWLARVTLPGTTGPGDILSTVASSLASDLATNGASNIQTSYSGSAITVSPVALNTITDEDFKAVVRQIDDYVLQVDITGRRKQIAHTIRANFNLAPERYPIFDFGLATKGPVDAPGNPTFIALNDPDEADVYIESAGHNLALDVSGNTNVDGDISIGNPAANVNFDGHVQIAGEYEQTAIDNHVTIGAEPVEFPVPDTDHFRQYATGMVIDGGTSTTDNMTLTNAVIAAGTNPRFEGNVVVEGVLFIEAPNVIAFDGNIDIRGLIVADGDVNHPGTNSLTFSGNFDSGPVPSGAEFDAMRDETGSSLLAPGFEFHLDGNFRSLGGVMAVSGAYFTGNIDAVVKGTMINYSTDPTVIEGNPFLRFDQSHLVETPAGFDSNRVPTYDPASYVEFIL